MQKLILVLNDQGGAVMSWDYGCVVSTLRREMKHHEPIVLIEEDDEESDSSRPLQSDRDRQCDNDIHSYKK